MSKPFVLRHVLSCTPERAWQAWTDAGEYARWFNAAPGVDAVVDELDVRPGGTMRFTMIGLDGESYPQAGTYVAVEAPHRLVTREVFEGMEMTMEVTLQASAAGTDMVITQTGVPEEIHDQAREGWAAILDKLAALVA